MESLRQTTSVAQYTTEFKALLLETPAMWPAEIVHAYVAGLKLAVKRHVLMAEPTTLEEAIAAAYRYDRATCAVH
jgi:hypothetical protein